MPTLTPVMLDTGCPGHPCAHTWSRVLNTHVPRASKTRALTHPGQVEHGLSIVQHCTHTCTPGAQVNAPSMLLTHAPRHLSYTHPRQVEHGLPRVQHTAHTCIPGGQDTCSQAPELHSPPSG